MHFSPVVAMPGPLLFPGYLNAFHRRMYDSSNRLSIFFQLDFIWPQVLASRVLGLDIMGSLNAPNFPSEHWRLLYSVQDAQMVGVLITTLFENQVICYTITSCIE